MIEMEHYVKEIIKLLSRTFPNAKIALKFNGLFQLLVVVILSAQCTDEKVNQISAALFKRFPTMTDFANASLPELEKLVYSTGFYKAKAKNIKAAARKLLKDFRGRIPYNMKDLLEIPGVARKTANVILTAGYGMNEGIVVDTHVARVSGMLGLVPIKFSEEKNAVKIEEILMKIVPKSDWGKFSYLLVALGRNICVARGRKCEICPLHEICPSSTDKSC